MVIVVKSRLARLFRMTISKSLILRALAMLALVPALALAQREMPLANALAAADAAWDNGQFDDALVRYRDVLRRDSLSTRAMYRAATLLAQRNDFDASITLFHKYLALRPGDADGRIGLARALAWSGHYAEAVAICDSLSAVSPANRDAFLLGSQARAWGGERAKAIARYDRWLADHPGDSEVWNELAKTWKWSGRSDSASAALRRAVAVDPRNVSARATLDRDEAMAAPSFEPTVTNTNDSDHNLTTTYGIRAGLTAPWRSRVVVDGGYRTATLASQRAGAALLRSRTNWTSLDDRWSVHAEAGAERLDASDDPIARRGARIEPLLAIGVSGRPASRVSLGASVARGVLDETVPAILTRIASTDVEGEAVATLSERVRLTAGGGWTGLRGGSGPNTRTNASGSARWSLLPTLEIGAALHTFGYSHAASDGYFAPRRYLLGEGLVDWSVGGDLGWQLASEVGLGQQAITAFDDSRLGRFAARFEGSLRYRPTPGTEWSVAGGVANAASPTTVDVANYRIVTIALRARLRL